MSALVSACRLRLRQPVPARAGSSFPSPETGSFPLFTAFLTSFSLHPSSFANARTETNSPKVRTPFETYSWGDMGPTPPAFLGAGKDPKGGGPNRVG